MIDAQAFLKDLRALEVDLHHETREAMKYAVEEAERSAKSTTLYQDRTGTLRSAITSWHTDTHGELSSNAPYARFVENGTRPHMIVGNPFLSFVWKDVPVSYRYVNHPGTKPTHFMEKAGEWGGAVLHDGLSAFTQDAIRRFNSKS